MRPHSAPKIRPLAVSSRAFLTVVAVASALHLSCSTQARGQTGLDNDCSHFNWNEATNWSGNALPLLTDQVIFGTRRQRRWIFLQTDQTVGSASITIDGFSSGPM